MYCLMLIVVGTDITRYIAMIRSHGTDELGGLRLVEGEDGEFHIEIPCEVEKKKLPEYYG